MKSKDQKKRKKRKEKEKKRSPWGYDLYKKT
jgi:hypothetical protein